MAMTEVLGLKNVEVPTIDLSERNSDLPALIVKACEEFGIFKLVNHGVSVDMILALEKGGLEFFEKPAWMKEKAGSAMAKPLGYGCKSIGLNGDVGGLEYLLLRANHFSSFHDSHISSCGLKEYVEGVRELACEVLDLMAEGLSLHRKGVFSNLIRDVENDSLLRLNHYPPSLHAAPYDDVGFGEHTDPQIMTLFRSNDVGGLQVCAPDATWIAVPPVPYDFYVMVGDVLKVMTNGRFQSVMHRVVTANTGRRRMSTMYFASPPLDARISPLLHPEAAEGSAYDSKCKYKAFTWSEYKKATYASRLGDCRLKLFKNQDNQKCFT